METIKLTQNVKSSGCSAKMPIKRLHEALTGYSKDMVDEKLLVGFDDNDDALVYDLGDKVMVQSLDFFPPMVDDPYTFGAITAANAISDIYAMNAKPSIAMNLICFPSCYSPSVMRAILDGAKDKAKEAGVVIAGGHTISDSEIKFGLSVTGFCSKDKFKTNSTCKLGHVLVLTKKLGHGAMITSKKGEFISDEEFALAVNSMLKLNDNSPFENLELSALTDVTGFSLIGHSYEMAKASKVSIKIDSAKVNFFDSALNAAKFGFLPEGLYNNLEYFSSKIKVEREIEQPVFDILFSPETSGGLLICLDENDAKLLVEKNEDYHIVGKVVPFDEKHVIIE